MGVRCFIKIKETRTFLGMYNTTRTFCATPGPLTPPPHLDEHPPWEWAYPLLAGGLIGGIAAAIYYSKSELVDNNVESEMDSVVAGTIKRASIAPTIVGVSDSKLEERASGVPPVSPNVVINSFPYLSDEARELASAFKYSGSFAIALGPPDFNHRSLVKHYLEDKRHAMVFSIHPQRHIELFRAGGVNNSRSAIYELLERSIRRSVDFESKIVPISKQMRISVPAAVGSDIFEKLTDFILNRGPSSDQFIWMERMDILLDYIDQLQDPQAKEREEAMLRAFLNWLVEVSIDREWTQVLLQSTDPNLINRLEKYMPIRANPTIRKLFFGEASIKETEVKLTKLLDRNEICMKPTDASFVVSKLGGSYLVLDEVVKLLLSGASPKTIVNLALQPVVVGLEKLLLESEYRVALWQILEKLVANYEATGKLYLPYRVVQYSPAAKAQFEGAWKELTAYLYYYEHPTLEIIRKETLENSNSQLPSSFISVSSQRVMTACSILIHDPDLNRVMWNEKKKASVTFFDYTKK